MSSDCCYAFCWTLLCIVLVTGWRVDDEVSSVAHVYADAGATVSLPCLPQSLRSNAQQDYALPTSDETQLFVWVREGKALQHGKVERNGILTLSKIAPTDAGLYTCQAEESYSDSEKTFTRNVAQVELHVKTTPPAPIALTVYPSSVLALLTWKLNGTGGYPIRSITAIYQPVTEDLDDPSWHRTYPQEAAPSTTQLEIYKLEPNTTYRFRVWATNKLGPGDYAEVKTTTKSDLKIEGLVTVSEAHYEANPWVLSIAVLAGSAGFTVLVLSFFLLQNKKLRSRRRTYASSETMELVTNIILNPSYVDNDRASLLYAAASAEDHRIDHRQSSPIKSNTVISNPVSL